MGFFRQLGVLLWKNFQIRKVQKIFLAFEIILPFLVFAPSIFSAVMAPRRSWEDTKREVEERQELCYYQPRALPSVGFVPFLESFSSALDWRKSPCETTPVDDQNIGSHKDQNFPKIVNYVRNVLNNPESVRELDESLNALVNLMQVNDMDAVLKKMDNFTKTTIVTGVNSLYQLFFEPFTGSSYGLSQTYACRGCKIDGGDLTETEFEHMCELDVQKSKFDSQCYCNASDRECNEKLAPRSSLMNGYILVTPENNATKEIVRKMEEWLHGFRWMKETILDLYVNADYYRDRFATSTLGKAFKKLEMDIASCVDQDGHCEQLRQLGALFDSSHKSAFLKLKASIETVAKSLVCFSTDRFRFVNSVDELQTAGRCLMKKNKFFAGLIFNSRTDLPKLTQYTIRIPSSNRHSFERDYFTSGFLFLQEAVDRAIIELNGNSDDRIFGGVYTQQFPRPCDIMNISRGYYRDGPGRGPESIIVCYFFMISMWLSWMVTVSLIVKNVVDEKETRLKEFMKMMGLSNLILWLGWFIQVFIQMFVMAIIIAIITVTAIFPKSAFLVVLLLLLLFAAATILQSFLFSTFFSRTAIAALSWGFLQVLLYAYPPSLIMQALRLSSMAHLFWCLIPQNALWWGVLNMEKGSTLSNIADSEKNGISMAASMGMLIASSIVHIFLIWYIEAVFPGEFGVPEPFYFLFTRSYWRPRASLANVKMALEIPEDIKGHTEEEPSGLTMGVAIRKLRKVFSNGKVALSNVSMNFYESQITGFLGHNGAGKTTTMSIITGMYPPTEGTVFVYGLDVRHNISKIRESLGLCPQHNILYGVLSARQHLKFYAALKGCPWKLVNQKVNEMLTELDMGMFADKPSKIMSGGMKRRLSVAAAFVGESKVVILDEPTAGVDPAARRQIWDLLLRKKQGRTIVMSTHHMDEADVLSDRIAIIGGGKIRCWGTTLFLKKCYGSGYRLSVVMKTEQSRTIPKESAPELPDSSPTPGAARDNQKQKILNFIKTLSPKASIIEDLGQETIYNIPSTNPAMLQKVFIQLESKLDELNISSYGVSEVKLEEVFLKSIGNEAGEEAQGGCCQKFCPRKKPEMVKKLVDSEPSAEPPDNDVNDRLPPSPVSTRSVEIKRSTGINLWMVQLLALFVKRFLNCIRNPKGAFCEIILPLLLVLAIAIISSLNFEEDHSKTLVPWQDEEPLAFFQSLKYNDSMSVGNKYISALNDQPGLGIRCIPGHSYSKSCKDSGVPKQTLSTSPPSDHCHCVNSQFTCKNTGNYAPPSWETSTNDIMFNLTGWNISQWIMSTEIEQGAKRYGGFSTGEASSSFVERLDWNLIESNIDKISIMLPYSNVKMGFNWKGSHWQKINEKASFLSQPTAAERVKYFLRGLEIRDSVKLWYNDTGISAPATLNILNNAILRLHVQHQSNKKEYGIMVTDNPLFDEMDPQHRKEGVGIALAVVIILSMSIIPASFVLFIIDETQSFAKHLQFVSGIGPFVYWVSTYMWDMVNFLIPFLGMVAIICGFKVQVFVETSDLSVAAFLLLFLYGLAIIPMMYPFTFLFKKPAVAFVVLSLMNLFIGFVSFMMYIYIIPHTYPITGGQTMDDGLSKRIGLRWGFSVFPQFCLVHGLMSFNMGTGLSRIQRRDVTGPEQLTCHYVMLAINACFWFGLVLFIEYFHDILKLCKRKRTEQKVFSRTEDEDVRREREILAAPDNKRSYALKIMNLTKVFRYCCNRKAPLPVVNNLCVGVAPGECFGLLGVNGAGKTTTFSMLTGKVSITSGDAWICGYSVSKQLDTVRQRIGFCPQFDALHARLTGREELKFYARVRGVKSSLIDTIVENLIKELGLKEHASRQAGTYSGGNKRKLSTAVAMIGNPSLILLDEPTAGMDPKAKRQLWNRIKKILRTGDTSIVLTSHSMEECEALCHRIGIMVNGSFRCLGGTQHLKNRFGHGYTLTLKLGGTNPDIAAVKQFVQDRFPGVELKEEHATVLRFKLPSAIKNLSDVYAGLVQVMNAFQIDDYTLAQPSLEELFVTFATNQQVSDATAVKKAVSPELLKK